MRTMTVVFLGFAVLAMSGENLAAAKRDFPNSGRCPINLKYVTNLRVCPRWDADGRRISNTALIPLGEFRKYGVSRMH